MSWEEGLQEYITFLKQKHSLSDNQIRDVLFAERIPIEVFATDLTPLQAASHYLAVHRAKTPREIGRILGRTTTEIDKFLSVKAPVLPTNGTYPIAAALFSDRTCSASEHLVKHLEAQGLTVAEIAKLLHKASTTIWTVHYRRKQR